jgi:hypothetical protein
MDAPKNKQELFAHLDDLFNTALDESQQNVVWKSGIDQSCKTNLRLVALVGDDHQVVLEDYIKGRAKRATD